MLHYVRGCLLLVVNNYIIPILLTSLRDKMTRERAVIHHSVLCPKLMTAQAKQTAWGWVTCGSYFWLRHGVWDLCVINDDDVWTLSCFCAIVDGGQKISSPGEAFRFAPGLKKIVLVFLFLVIYSTGTQ